MPIRIIGVLVLSLLACAGANGQTDVIGVYFDPFASNDCLNGPQPFVIAYVVYSHPSVPEIVGYDLGIVINQYPQAPLDILSVGVPCAEGEFDIDQISVRCDTPLACGTHTTLCTMVLAVTGGFTTLSVTGATTPSLPLDGPFVVLDGGQSLLLDAGDSEAVLDDGYAYCGDLAAESVMWGAVKALYRP